MPNAQDIIATLRNCCLCGELIEHHDHASGLRRICICAACDEKCAKLNETDVMPSPRLDRIHFDVAGS